MTGSANRAKSKEMHCLLYCCVESQERNAKRFRFNKVLLIYDLRMRIFTLLLLLLSCTAFYETRSGVYFVKVKFFCSVCRFVRRLVVCSQMSEKC
jgi:hypothetical protein